MTLKRLLGLLAVLLILPLLGYLILGTHNRALADDFCFTVNARAKGIVESLNWYYNNWTGTYSSTFFQSLIGLSGSWRLTPLILLGFFALASVWTTRQVALTLKLIERRYVVAVLALLFSFGVITGTANVFQSFYWTSGGITYTAPLILLIFHVGILLAFIRQGAKPRLGRFILLAGLSLLAGGFSPLFAVFQVTTFGLAILFVLRYAAPDKRPYSLRLLSVSLVFALAALVILVAAPGNAIRQAAFEKTVSLPEAAVRSLIETIRFIPTAAAFLSPLAIILPLIISGLVAFYCHPLTPAERVRINRQSLKWLGLSALIGYLLMASAFFTVYYSIGQLPEPRGYVEPQSALVLLMMAWGYIMGLGLQKQHTNRQQGKVSPVMMVAVLGLTAFGALQATAKPVSLLPAFQTFAQEWDARDAYLTAYQPDGQTLQIEPFSKDLASYAWLNDQHLACIRDYYHQPDLVIPEREPEPPLFGSS